MKNSCIFVFVACLFLLMFGCNFGKNKESNVYLFQKYFEKNVSACTKILTSNGTDSLAAKENCECMLNAYFRLDSTFVQITNDSDRDDFFRRHLNEIDSICDQRIK